MLIYAAGALVVLIALPVLAETLRKSVRKGEAPGQFARLSRGETHFRWMGPEDGPVAVCVHGLSTPSYAFAATERSLAGMGFRVLTYDLYGRGYSARPGGGQTSAFFIRQLNDLLAHEGIGGPILLVGYSMGGAIAAAYAAAAPRRVSHLILIAPAGLVPVYDDWTGRLWTLPVVGDWATRVFGGMALRRELVEHRTHGTVIPDFEDRQAAETHTRGYLPALLSSRRHMLREPQDMNHREIGRAGVPVLAIWGTEDPIIPLTAMARLAELNPDAHHAQVAGAGHVLLQTHPANVAAALKRFLQDHAA